MMILIRFTSDITTKAKPTRRRFLRRLANNIAAALEAAGIVYTLRQEWSRFFLQTSDERVPQILQTVFGITSLSPVQCFPLGDLTDLVRRSTKIFHEQIRDKRFAVRARRGDRTPSNFNSLDIERALGAALLPYAERVDLSHPEVTAQVELRDGQAYCFTDALRGPGGLPLGTAGRAVALVSGGFDSAVAAWKLLKRGVTLDFVTCNLGGAAQRQSTLRVLKFLTERWTHGTRPRLYLLDFAPVVRDLQANCAERYWQVLLKRLMLRAAERIARERGALGIVTGEAIGQVSSQTLANLKVISQTTNWPLLRPLLGDDKQEIMDTARRIGTYELSAAVKEYCALTLHHPATGAGLRAVLTEEAKLDPAALQRALEGRQLLDLVSVDPDELASPGLQIAEIPAGAEVIDLRDPGAFQRWHYPGARQMDFLMALKDISRFDRDRSYVFYCQLGLKSGQLAEELQQAGYQAYSFKGGLRALQRYVQAQG